jgi:hypothetical protein
MFPTGSLRAGFVGREAGERARTIMSLAAVAAQPGSLICLAGWLFWACQRAGVSAVPGHVLVLQVTLSDH